MEKSPCRGCDERRIGCHASCEKYIDWKNRQLKICQSRIEERLKMQSTPAAIKRHNKWLKEHKR